MKPIPEPHTQTAEALLAALRSSPDGLSPDEAAARLAANGPNELRETISRPAWRMLLAQFIEPMILILIAAAILSLCLGDWTEGAAILAIVVMFGILGFLQEYRAEKAMAALKRLSCPSVRVRRDGELRECPARDLVPGDIVLLEEGNIVPADLRILSSINLSIAEATLTGEAVPAEKRPDVLPFPDLPLGDRANLAFMGTTVSHGRATALVLSTGMDTELGKIAGMIQSMDESHTPLQRKLAQVGKHLSLAGLVAAVAVFGLALWQAPAGQLLKALPAALLTAVSLLVAVVPEGLPAVITATLALGARRMLRRHALIRKLPAVETLGSVTVICSDKTGTLTENRMTATRLITLRHDLPLDPAAPYAPLPSSPDLDAARPELVPMLVVAALCNDGHLVRDTLDAPPTSIGDPTETALLAAAERLSIPHQALRDELPRAAESPFDSDRKRMATYHQTTATDYPLPPALAASAAFAAVKGAPDSVLALSTHVLDHGEVVPLAPADRDRLLARNAQLAGQGIRVLGFAFRPLQAPPPASPAPDPVANERELVFLGLVAMIDPPRAAVRPALAAAHSAGIRTVMITGDHPLTASAIAADLSLPFDDPAHPVALSGADLAAMPDDDLSAAVLRTSVYARVSPQDKLRIVSALQGHGHIVAMTGDGVNDSPALKRADIGVAMGITGTDVAKESAKMVLLDDNFATIVAAIEEGRTIFDNLVRFIKYSFGGNLAKVAVMLAAPFALPAVARLLGGFDAALPANSADLLAIALRPLHLLWLNLLTDGLMGLGLGLEAPEANVMRRPPRKPDAPIFDRPTIVHVLWMGAFIALGSLLLAGWALHAGGPWQTVLFTAIGLSQIGQAWGLRSLTGRAFRFAPNLALLVLTLLTILLQFGVTYYPPLAHAFALTPLPPIYLLPCLLFALLTFLLVHLDRHLRR